MPPSCGRALLSRFNGEQLQVNKGLWSGMEHFVEDDDEESEYSVLQLVPIVFSFLGLIILFFILEAYFCTWVTFNAWKTSVSIWKCSQHQGCQTCGPRATRGPSEMYMRPPSFIFTKLCRQRIGFRWLNSSVFCCQIFTSVILFWSF